MTVNWQVLLIIAICYFLSSSCNNPVWFLAYCKPHSPVALVFCDYTCLFLQIQEWLLCLFDTFVICHWLWLFFCETGSYISNENIHKTEVTIIIIINTIVTITEDSYFSLVQFNFWFILIFLLAFVINIILVLLFCSLFFLL